MRVLWTAPYGRADELTLHAPSTSSSLTDQNNWRCDGIRPPTIPYIISAFNRVVAFCTTPCLLYNCLCLAYLIMPKSGLRRDRLYCMIKFRTNLLACSNADNSCPHIFQVPVNTSKFVSATLYTKNNVYRDHAFSRLYMYRTQNDW